MHLSIYAPNAFEIYDQVTKVLLELSGFILVIGADLNATLMDHSVNRSGQSENIQQQASEALQSWTNNIGAVGLWRMLNPNSKDFTHLSVRHKSFWLRLHVMYWRRIWFFH